MRQPRLIAALSIPLGFVLNHLAAYTLASGGPMATEAAAHPYLESLSQGAVPMALFAIVIAVFQGRKREAFTIRASALVGQLVAVYVAIELIEHLAIGVPLGEILTERTLFVGVAVQVVVGFALHRLLRAGHRLGELLSDTERPVEGCTALAPMPASQLVRARLLRSSIRLRGTPTRAFASSL